MKTCLLGITILLGSTLFGTTLLGTTASADPKEEISVPTQKDSETSLSQKKRKVLVITEAKFIPLTEFLGLPNVNKLPPTSAGEPESSQR